MFKHIQAMDIASLVILPLLGYGAYVSDSWAERAALLLLSSLWLVYVIFRIREILNTRSK